VLSTILAKIFGKSKPTPPARAPGPLPPRPLPHRPGAGLQPVDAVNGQYVDRSIGEFRMRVATQRLETVSGIAGAMTFVRPLSREINLAPALYSHICPVEVAADSRKCAVLCSERMSDSEELIEVLRTLRRKGYAPADGLTPNLFICTLEAVVLSVSKEQVTGDDVARRRKVLGAGPDSSLWQNFLGVVGFTLRNNASEIHFNIMDQSDRSQIRFTIDGKYVAPESHYLPTKLLWQMASVAYQQSKGGNGADFNPLIEQQCRIQAEIPTGEGKSEPVMLRWASMATDDGPQITLRPLRLDALEHAYTLESLGYLPSQIGRLHRAMVSEGGAVIVSGVLGSGKSTLLATLMRRIPSTRKVMTIEDPREYIIPGAHQNTIQRALDTDDDSAFFAKLRTLKRTGFNEFMIGEIRDRQTGQAFQDVVESGPNVYTTVHARRHIGIPDRLASPFIGVDRAVLATPGILKLLVAQVLLPLNCPHCAIAASEAVSGRVQIPVPDAGGWSKYLGRLQGLFDIDLKELRLRNPEGCGHCRRSGLPELAGLCGRTVAAEMVEPDDTFLEHVRHARNIELERHVAGMRNTPVSDPDDTGKSALQVAMYHVSTGAIDPREVEPRFESFETVEMKAGTRTRHRDLVRVV
jgi:general secretion pathway protein E